MIGDFCGPALHVSLETEYGKTPQGIFFRVKVAVYVNLYGCWRILSSLCRYLYCRLNMRFKFNYQWQFDSRITQIRGWMPTALCHKLKQRSKARRQISGIQPPFTLSCFYYDDEKGIPVSTSKLISATAEQNNFCRINTVCQLSNLGMQQFWQGGIWYFLSLFSNHSGYPPT